MFQFAILFAFIITLVAGSAELRSPDDTTYPEPITLGQLGYSHGHTIIAWTPTKTTINDACTNSSTYTAIRAENSGYALHPLCGYPFNLDGYTGLELQCADGTSMTASQVTAIATNGKITHNCTYLPLTISYTSCGVGSGIAQLYACQ